MTDSEEVLSQLRTWASTYGASLCPGTRPDTFGEGMREAKAQVARILGSRDVLNDTGKLVVVRAGAENPYHEGASLLGNERVRALQAFFSGGNVDGYEFWLAPVEGGARKVQPGDVMLTDDALRYLVLEKKG